MRGTVMVIRDETERRHAGEERRHVEELERQLLQIRLRKAGEELDHSKEQVRSLAARLLTAQEDERRRIARELQDELAHRVLALDLEAMQLEKQIEASSEERAVQFAQLRERIGSFWNELRQIGDRLHPEMLEDLGLESSLKELVEEFSRHWPAPVDYAAQSVPQRIGLQLTTTLHRIAQEALLNIRKHAPGAPVAVLLSGSGGVLELTIEDAGPGFAAGTSAGGGLGLATIAERVRLHGGSSERPSRICSSRARWASSSPLDNATRSAPRCRSRAEAIPRGYAARPRPDYPPSSAG